MKYEMEAENAQIHAKRFKIRDERHVDRDNRLLAEGRARTAQRMADLQKSRNRAAQ